MSFIPGIIQYAGQGPFELTRKDFSIDDRTSNGFTYQSWNSGSDVNGGYWRALTTDGNGACYKNYANIYSGSYIRMRGYVNYSYWGGGVTAVLEDTNQGGTYIQCGIATSSYGGYTRFHVYSNGVLLHTYNIATGVFYEIELILLTSTTYVCRLYSSDGVTVLSSYNGTTTNVPKWVRGHLNTTTDNLQYCDWMETKIYY